MLEVPIPQNELELARRRFAPPGSRVADFRGARRPSAPTGTASMSRAVLRAGPWLRPKVLRRNVEGANGVGNYEAK